MDLPGPAGRDVRLRVTIRDETDLRPEGTDPGSGGKEDYAEIVEHSVI
jgi:hypothetical protein